ncbi:amidohydrolase family-domain-containing protein [Gymnopilus junonius]|uniref:Amidohydrolase family-domain-containing protein n=1 Tax=Gymnopilus junonius TaxID=109634 RepID=A0A9P5NK95_GYMJU|nr:amidohydrolase family-domain-containing protein [Gymnopilus junonius]
MPSNGSDSVGGADDDTKDHDSVNQAVSSSFATRAWTLWALLFAILGSLLASFLAKETASTFSPRSYALCTKHDDKVYTVDEKNSQTQCIVVNGAHIVGTGSLETVRRNWSELFEISEKVAPPPFLVRFVPDGASIIPGISDSHAHILEYGATQQLPLEGAKTIQDAVALVREYILTNSDIFNDTSKFIIGGGWDHTIWPSWPSADDLDADIIVRGRPVVLQSKDCHALWVSSKVIERSLPIPEDVEGGVIIRDPAGKPTGVLLDNAQDILKLPELTESDLLRQFKVTVRDAHRYGITSIHDAGLDPKSLAFFKRQEEIGTLPLRIYGMTYFNEDQSYWGNTSVPLIATGDARLSARSVKIFADALRTGGAALYEPYADNPETSGFLRLDPDVLFDVIPKFLRDGWQVNVHAIGDRANGIVLDAFEASLKGANVTALRPRLEHAQIMTRADMVRLGKLGVIASIQPTHAISDMWYAEDRLGPERVKSLYAFRSIIDSGAKITLGSDSPVETMNPFSAFYAAITRISPSGESPHGPTGWFPEQKLTRTEALRGMTIDPAYASFSDSTLGSLEIGKRADFTILSQDIMTVPVKHILSTRVLATIIDGELVFGDI